MSIETGTYIITEEQMANVSTYVPLRAKTEWVQIVADKCIDKVEMTATGGEGQSLPMPPMYKENSERKSLFLMGALVRLYLHGTWETDEPDRKDEPDDYRTWLIPLEEYDKWAGGHVFGQIDRHKANKELKSICFDLMNDFKDLERRLNTEVRALLEIMNDPAARQTAAMQLQLTPEAMENTLDELKKAQEALQAYNETRSTDPNSEEEVMKDG